MTALFSFTSYLNPQKNIGFQAKSSFNTSNDLSKGKSGKCKR